MTPITLFESSMLIIVVGLIVGLSYWLGRKDGKSCRK